MDSCLQHNILCHLANLNSIIYQYDIDKSLLLRDFILFLPPIEKVLFYGIHTPNVIQKVDLCLVVIQISTV